MIQPIIAEIQSQRETVRRLVQHIKNLDGTEVKIVPISPEEDAAFIPDFPDNALPCRAAFSLRTCASAMKGKPFIWLEHDAIPLKAGWVKALTDEYYRLEKPFMLSCDTHPPHDLCGGIGVYGPDTHWMIPQQLRREANRMIGWDLWMVRNIPELISWTQLIQHSYGVYDLDGIASPHRFPRDSAMLRESAVIFHADKNHDLITGGQQRDRTFYHSGDLGDIIYHLEVLRRMGGGRLMLGEELFVTSASHCREPMTGQRYELIRQLLLPQPYIHGIAHVKGKLNPTWINLNKFREKLPSKANLQRACLRKFDLMPQDETQPWLRLPNEFLISHLDDRIVAARSPRYHEPLFPWRNIVERYRERILFVGLPEEHADFKRRFGVVEYYPTKNLLEVAGFIASCSIFIGNQSSPYAIAEGLKKPAIQETWEPEPNCLFERPNVLNRCNDFDRIVEFIEKFTP